MENSFTGLYLMQMGIFHVECYIQKIRPKLKVVLFPEIGRVKILLSLTRIGMYIFNLKTKTK